MKASALPLAIAVIVVVVAGAAAYYFYYGGQLEIPEAGEEVMEKKSLTGLEIAERIADSVEAQRNADGFYNYAANCDASAGCMVEGEVFENANAWPVYGYAALYQTTSDQKYLDAAVRDADAMLAWCEGEPLVCSRTTYQLEYLYGLTGDQRYRDLMVSEAEMLVDPASESGNIDLSMMLATDAIVFAGTHVATSNSTYLEAAASRIDGAEAKLGVVDVTPVLFEVDGRTFSIHSCWPQLAKLYVHRAGGGDSYLSEARDFAEKMNLPGNIHHLWFMTDIQPCIDLYQRLGEVTGEASFTDGANQMIQHVLDGYWDSAENPKVSGDDSIKSAKDQTFSTVTDSAYMVFLLSKAKDVEFEVAK